MKKFRIFLCSICIISILFTGMSDQTFATCKHRFTGKTSTEMVRTIHSTTKETKVGSPVSGGWIRRTSPQAIFKSEGIISLQGKVFSTEKTVSFEAGLSVPLKATLETAIDCSKTWKKSTLSVTGKTSAANKNNTKRYASFCTRSLYQKYNVTYVTKTQKYCVACKKYVTTKKSAPKTVVGYKKVDCEGAFFYSDSKSALTNLKSTSVYGANNIKLESSSRYLQKNSNILKGEANKNNQNFNAFSHISKWR